MNQCVIIGNLTSDPELRQTPNGKSVVKFTVAVNNGKDSDGKDRPWYSEIQFRSSIRS